MKRLIVIALWVFATTPARSEVDHTVLLSLSASVLKIEVLRVQGGFSLGSGVVVAAETLVTNCHVTRDAVKINVLRGGVRWLATAQQSDIDRDLCVLRVPGLQASAVPLGQAERLAPGQTVSALGYTGGLGLQSSQGEVIALHRVDGGRVIQSSNWFSSGASGGGLFDEELRLVGILTFRLRGGDAHYFAAPVEWLTALLDSTQREGYAEVAPDRSTRLAYWQRPVREQPRFLKAALLQHDNQWSALELLAIEWAGADASDPEPWYLMGVALARMNRLPEAERALECALAIEPASAAAAARLASMRGDRGLSEGAPPVASTNAPCAMNAMPSTPR